MNPTAAALSLFAEQRRSTSATGRSESMMRRVCDDGSTPGSGGTDTNGPPICADGDDAHLPGDTAGDSASHGICDDASNPGDGGTDSSGAPLCADGTDPSY